MAKLVKNDPNCKNKDRFGYCLDAVGSNVPYDVLKGGSGSSSQDTAKFEGYSRTEDICVNGIIYRVFFKKFTETDNWREVKREELNAEQAAASGTKCQTPSDNTPTNGGNTNNSPSNNAKESDYSYLIKYGIYGLVGFVVLGFLLRKK